MSATDYERSIGLFEGRLTDYQQMPLLSKW